MKIKKLLIYSLIIIIISTVFYSCSLFGVKKIERIEMFQDSLNNNMGDQKSAENLVEHFHEDKTSIYNQIAVISWWQASTFASACQDFSITNKQEDGDVITATISSNGGADGAITFTMSKKGLFDWYIVKVHYGGTDIIY